MKTYTKADLEELVYSQLESMNAMHDVLCKLKKENNLRNRIIDKLKKDLVALNKKMENSRK